MSADRRELFDSEEESRLLADVASIKDRPEFHDVAFLCRDGVFVRANRAFIASRSEFFDKLLFGEMKEANESTINFPGVSSAPLCLVLEYLHTCSVNSIEADTVAVEAYDLARQYGLTGLQKLIVTYLVNHARQHECIGPIVSSALKLEASDIAEKILPVVSSALEEGKASLFDGFSVDALVFILNHPNLRAGWPDEVDILKSVLNWAVSRYGVRCLSRSPSWTTNEQLGLSTEEVQSLQQVFMGNTESEVKEWLSVLKGVRLERIPTNFIRDKIEPLGLIPIEFLTRVYCHQACTFSAVALKCSLWDPTCRGTEVRIEQDLCDFQCKTHQAVRVQTPFTSGVHQWEIRIEKYCDLVWVGVVAEGADMNEWVGRQKNGWMLGSNGALCHDTQQDNGPYNIKYGTTFRENACLIAKLDMNKRELGFCIDGVDYGVAFTQLPSKVYPAVSCRSPGAIRISFGDKLWALVHNISKQSL